MSKLTSGRAIALGFAAFAVVCLVATWDYGRGRVAVTSSPVIADVIAQGAGRNCSVDVSDVMLRQFPVGMPRAEAEAKLAAAYIVPPRPWFWTPVMQDRTDLKADAIRAVRTVRTSAFGPMNLEAELLLAEGKVTSVKGRIACAFD
jgi:hypothetical protein